MKKITVLLSLVAAAVLLMACNSKKSESASEETPGEKKEVNGIAQHVVEDALSRVQDADADVDDVTPMLDEPYLSEDDSMWMFDEEEGELEGEYTTVKNGTKHTICRLSKRGPGAYDAYPGERAVAMCVLRVKDGGDIIEMTEGSKTIVFKSHDRIMRDAKTFDEEMGELKSIDPSEVIK